MVPQAGDVTVCAGCCNVLVFIDDGVRIPTPEELKDLERNDDVRKGMVTAYEESLSRSATCVFSGADKNYMPLAELTFPAMFTWAMAHRYQFKGFMSMPEPHLNQYWTGVAWGLKLLRAGYRRVIYLDADQLITNFSRDFKHIPYSGFHASKDWGNDATEPWHFSMCGFIAHEDCIPLFEAVLAMEPEWRDQPFQEQGPFREQVRQMFEANDTGLIHIHPRKVLNCVPDQILPGEIPEPWSEEDFAAHLTMVPIEQRIQLVKKFSPVIIDNIKRTCLPNVPALSEATTT